MRVVIAEDEALIRVDLQEMLEEDGHEVVGAARDGVEAVELVRETRPDVVFLDIRMPRMDGIEAADIITGERLAPVVMITAFAESEQVEQACRAGAMGYVTKPFTRNDVVPAMHVAVSRHTEAEALAKEVADLNERLETRTILDRAKGALMARGLTEPEAFRRIQKTAMDKRLSLRAVAEAILLAEEVDG